MTFAKKRTIIIVRFFNFTTNLAHNMNLRNLTYLLFLFLVSCGQPPAEESETSYEPNPLTSADYNRVTAAANNAAADEYYNGTETDYISETPEEADAYAAAKRKAWNQTVEFNHQVPTEKRRAELLKIGHSGGFATFESGGMSTRTYYLRDHNYDTLPQSEQKILMEGFDDGWFDAKAKERVREFKAEQKPKKRK